MLTSVLPFFALTILPAILLTKSDGKYVFSSSEESISDALVYSLDHSTTDWAHTSMMCAAYSGNVNNRPLEKPIVETEPQIMGLTQQSLWGIFQTLPRAQDTAVGYETGLFMIYRRDGLIYAFREAGASPCEDSYSNGAVNSDCRKIFSYGPNGVVNDGTKAIYNTKNYDPRVRVWYKAAAEKGGPSWSPLFMASPVIPPSYIPGFSFGFPFYDSSSGALLGVCGSEIDIRQIVDLLHDFDFAISGQETVAFILETSSVYLVGSSIGEYSTYNNSHLINTALDAKNRMIRLSTEYIYDGSTFKPDGNYIISLNTDDDDEVYCLNLISYTDPQSQTLDWKIVVVSDRDDCEDSNDYTRELSESTTILTELVQNVFEGVSVIPGVFNFHAGANIDAPLGNIILNLATDPNIDGLSRQSLWLATDIFSDEAALQSLGVVYVSNGTVLSYSRGYASISSSFSYLHRNFDASNNCPQVGSYPEIDKDCLRVYDVFPNGSYGSILAQYVYDARNESWFVDATNRGSLTWTSMYESTLDGSRVMTVTVPNYDSKNSQKYCSVSFATLNLSYFDGFLVSSIPPKIVAFLVDHSTGLLLSTSVQEVLITDTGTFVPAINASNIIIRESYRYMKHEGFSTSSMFTFKSSTGDEITVSLSKYVGSIGEYIDIDIVLCQKIDSYNTNDSDDSDSAFSSWEKGDVIAAAFTLGTLTIVFMTAAAVLLAILYQKSKNQSLLLLNSSKAHESRNSEL